MNSRDGNHRFSQHKLHDHHIDIMLNEQHISLYFTRIIQFRLAYFNKSHSRSTDKVVITFLKLAMRPVALVLEERVRCGRV